jgi:hypothetical protein
VNGPNDEAAEIERRPVLESPSAIPRAISEKERTDAGEGLEREVAVGVVVMVVGAERNSNAVHALVGRGGEPVRRVGRVDDHRVSGFGVGDEVAEVSVASGIEPNDQ